MTAGAYVSITGGMFGVGGFVAYDSAGNIYAGPYIGTPGIGIGAGAAPNLEGFLTGWSISGSPSGVGLRPHFGTTAAADVGVGFGTPGIGLTYGVKVGNWPNQLFGPQFIRRDPLVIDLNFDGARLTPLVPADQVIDNPAIPSTYFDLDGDGFEERTGWVSSKDGLLALDINSNGQIDNGLELFGSSEQDGFTSLASYDSNADGKINSQDSIFSSLRIWQDVDLDGVSQSYEIFSLGALDIEEIDLENQHINAESQGNIILSQGQVLNSNGDKREIISVAFATDQLNTRFQPPIGFEYDQEVFSLPDLRGYGSVPDLWVAMSLDPILKEMVQDFLAGGLTSLGDTVGTPFEVVIPGTPENPGGSVEYHYAASEFENILARWAGVPIDSGNQDEAQAQATAEAFLNRAFMPDRGAGNPNFHALFQKFSSELALRFFVQVPYAQRQVAIIDAVQNIFDATPTNGISFTSQEEENLFSALLDAFQIEPVASGSLANYADLDFDFYWDKITGDIPAFVDKQLISFAFDSNNPWDGYAEWYANHRLELEVVDPDGSILAQEHRKYTGNLALSILTAPHDELAGDANANTIIGDQVGAANPDLIKGLGGNDTLQGGGGSDTYVMSDGDGSDTIIDTSGISDELAFQGGLTSDLARYSFADGAHRDLQIEFEGRSESVLIEDYFTTTGEATIEHITFPDGPEISHRDVRNAVYEDLGTSGNDTITGFVLGTTINGKGGNDVLAGQDNADELIGGTGNDTLTAYGSDDILRGGTGNDRLNGGTGNDSYYFEAGDGQDTISEDGDGGNDTLFLGEGITPEDVTVTQDEAGHNFILTFAGSTDQILLFHVNTYSDGSRIDQVQFADGTIWSFTDMFERSIVPTTGNDAFYGSADSDVMEGGAGDDVLEGRGGNDRLIGGVGNDSLNGNGGNDTFVFGIGDGQDVATEYDGNGGGFDTVLFGAGISANGVTIEQVDSGNDIVIKINGTTDQIRLDNTNIGNPNYKIDQIKFNDGTTWSFADLLVRVTTATSGNDVFWGDETANLLSGAAGNDTLSGNNGNDTLAGGTGDDWLYGNWNDDTYLFGIGDGSDVATEYGASGLDTLQLGPGITADDLSFEQTDSGQDIVIRINGTTDQIRLDNTNTSNGNYKIDQVRFDDGTLWSFADLLSRVTASTNGNDKIWGDEVGNALSGGAGNDTIYGGSGHDTLAGGTGDDWLYGNWDDDTYLFGIGDGSDVITEYGESGLDTLQLGPGITADDLSFEQIDSGQDIVIKINGTTDQIRLDNTNTSNVNYKIDQVRFDDGTLWSFADLLSRVTASTSGNDVISGDEVANSLSGGAGNDTIYGGSGHDTLAGGTGDDWLYGNWDDDTFLFGIGDGSDVISDESGTDTLQLGVGITTDNLSFDITDGGQDITIKVDGTTDQIRLDDTNTGNPAYAIDQIRFNDGTVWTLADLISHALADASGATDGPDMINGTPLGDTLYGGLGEDTINGSTGNDLLNGGADNDLLLGESGNDTLDGGAGDDRLEGNNDHDTYRYNVDEGDDVISEYTWYFGGENKLEFGSGIAPTNLIFSRSPTDPSDVVMSFSNGSGSVTLDNQLSTYEWGIDQVSFADGTIWSALDLHTHFFNGIVTSGNDSIGGSWMGDLINGSGGNDTLRGFAGNDTLEGAGGDDRLEGDDGDDVYRYASNGGADVISEYAFLWGSYDKLEFGSGITASNIVFAQSSSDASDIILSFSNASGSVTLDGQFATAEWGVDEVRFADGTIWNITDLRNNFFAGMATGGNDLVTGSWLADSITGGAGDDTLRGGNGNDTLSGGADNDRLEGSDGDDTYQFALNGGDDVISDYAWYWGSYNTLKLATGIAPTNLTFSRSTVDALDMVINFNNGAGSITIDNQLSSRDWGIDQIDFADGTTWSISDLYTHYFAGLATSGSDLIDGSWMDDTIAGAAGNDTLRGMGGNDTYYFDLGHGQDVIQDHVYGVGGYGEETIEFGTGIDPADVAVTFADNGNDLVLTNNVTGDKVRLEQTVTDPGYRIEQVRFADNTIWTHADLMVFAGAAPLPPIEGTSGADSLYGTSGNDTILGYAGDDYLDGGGGSDTYLYASGHGSDTISEGGVAGTDVLKLTDLDPEDVELRHDGYHLFVRDVSTGHEIKINYQFYGSGPDGIEEIRFADSTVWDRAKIQQEAWYRGTTGNDNLSGTSADETFVGGLGNDYLDGGGGSDAYLYASGHGSDTISEGGVAGTDVLKLTDLDPENVELRQDGYHLFVRDVSTGHEIKVNYQFYGSGPDGIEEIRFADSAVWDRAKIQQEAWYRGTSGADSFTGTNADETLIGYGGNDYLAGGFGSDSYIYASGEGADDIYEQGFSGSDTDILKLTDLNAADVSLRTDGMHVWLFDSSTGSEIRIQYQFYDASSGLERIEFQNGDFWTRADISVLVAGGQVLLGGSGNDTLTGGSANDRLKGGAGNDNIDGGSGSGDVAIFSGIQSDYTLTTVSGTTTVVDDQSSIDGNDGTDTLFAVEKAEFKGGTQVSLAPPIVLDLDGDGVELIDRKRSKARFDWDGDGDRDRTGWVGKDDGLLAFDRNGDGKITAANELSFVDDMPDAKSDLDGLSAFDTNHDGIFSAEDDAFGKFGVWRDRNGNGRTDRGELLNLAKAGITSINLSGTAVDKSWEWDDNLVINTGTFTRKNGAIGTLNDVALNYVEASAGRSRHTPSLHASRFAEAIGAFKDRGLDEVALAKHDMDLSKSPIFAGHHSG